MKKIYVIGIGPGNEKFMTAQAKNALSECDILCGYTVYIDLIKDIFPNKKILTTPMKQEIDRCHMALEEASDGNTVAMVCSGDAGVYGMAGLIYQLSTEYTQVEIEVIPGITAALSGASVLGAPLIHDFAVISLSDLLTPWEKIEKRILCASNADFVICFYNPSSKKRHDYLQKACDLIMQYQSPNTVCGIVKNIGREGEEGTVMSLKELRDTEVDMFTTVFVGNTNTKIINGKMVTPRGYENHIN